MGKIYVKLGTIDENKINDEYNKAWPHSSEVSNYYKHHFLLWIRRRFESKISEIDFWLRSVANIDLNIAKASIEWYTKYETFDVVFYLSLYVSDNLMSAFSLTFDHE